MSYSLNMKHFYRKCSLRGIFTQLRPDLNWSNLASSRIHHLVAPEKLRPAPVPIFRRVMSDWFYRGPMSENSSLWIVRLSIFILSLLFFSQIFTFFSENDRIKILDRMWYLAISCETLDSFFVRFLRKIKRCWNCSVSDFGLL
jgi:hypothetical protein